jgi:hypothetical protein
MILYLNIIYIIGDGIFDRMNNCEIMKMIWNFKKRGNNFGNIHVLSGNIVDSVIKKSMVKLSTDNLSAIFIGFKNFEDKMKDPDFEYKAFSKCTNIKDQVDFSVKK